MNHNNILIKIKIQNAKILQLQLMQRNYPLIHLQLYLKLIHVLEYKKRKFKKTQLYNPKKNRNKKQKNHIK